MFKGIEGSILKDEVIKDFCGECSHLKQDLSCGVECNADRKKSVHTEANLKCVTDQERYILRDWCGAAFVDGSTGEMTSNGFKARQEA